MSRIKIYQAFHKPYYFNRACKWITPVGVGGAQLPEFISDNTLDNISHLNPYYCELTMIYYVWKNTDDDFVGFYHYRRFLNFVHKQKFFHPAYELKYDMNKTHLEFLTSEEQFNNLKKILKISDVVMPAKGIFIPSIENQYVNFKLFGNETWEVFLDTIKDFYNINDDLIQYFKLAHSSASFNMFIMSRNILNYYCSDLFSILDIVYRKIGTPYDSGGNRYPGYLAERFIGFWLLIKRISYFETPVVEFK
jgi:hypothetical protein